MDYTKRTRILWAASTELAAGHSNTKNVHPFFHLLYVRYGKGIFVCDDSVYHVSKGTCILVLPHVYHEIPAEDHSLLGFHEIKFEITDPYLSENLLKTQTISLADSFFDTVLSYICENYTQENDEEILVNIDCLFSALLTLMFLKPVLPKDPSSQYIVGTEYNHTTHKIINYIEKNSNIEFKLEHLGHSLGMHPNYLCTSFKKNTGHSIIDYLAYVRIRDALQTMYFRYNTPLNEVAFQSGFGSVSHFNRVFKKYTGTTPSSILNLIKSNTDSSNLLSKQIHDDYVIKRCSSIKEAFDKLLSMRYFVSNSSADNNPYPNTTADTFPECPIAESRR